LSGGKRLSQLVGGRGCKPQPEKMLGTCVKQVSGSKEGRGGRRTEVRTEVLRPWRGRGEGRRLGEGIVGGKRKEDVDISNWGILFRRSVRKGQRGK